MMQFAASMPRRLRLLFPGLVSSLTVALAAKFVSEHYGAPVMLIALLLGMAFAFLAEPGAPTEPGIEFASRALLRFGVALLGLGITVQQIAAAGVEVVFVILAGVALTIAGGVVLARLSGRSLPFGLLAGGAVAICGASAALAIASVLPKTDPNHERDTIFTVIAVTALSTLAMILYPIIGAALGLSDHAMGVFFGATIHDVAQVVGAGYSVSDEAGATATFVKLLRVALLVPVVVGLSVVFGKGRARPAPRAADPVLRHRLCRAGAGRQRQCHPARGDRAVAGTVALVPDHRHRGAGNEDLAEEAGRGRRWRHRHGLRADGAAGGIRAGGDRAAAHLIPLGQVAQTSSRSASASPEPNITRISRRRNCASLSRWNSAMPNCAPISVPGRARPTSSRVSRS